MLHIICIFMHKMIGKTPGVIPHTHCAPVTKQREVLDLYLNNRENGHRSSPTNIRALLSGPVWADLSQPSSMKAEAV